MLLTKLKTTLAALLLLGAMTLTCVVLATGQTDSRDEKSPGRASGQSPQAKLADTKQPSEKGSKQGDIRYMVEYSAWLLVNVDAGRQTISARPRPEPHVGIQIEDVGVTEGPHSTRWALEDYTVARDARIMVNGKEGRLADLKPMMRLSLKLSADQPAFHGSMRPGLGSTHTG